LDVCDHQSDYGRVYEIHDEHGPKRRTKESGTISLLIYPFYIKMIGWIREISEQMFTLSKKMNKIESLVVNKGDKEIVIFSAPREEIYFKKIA
jgi:hypothetical protein